jgi:hypothetical protein
MSIRFTDPEISRERTGEGLLRPHICASDIYTFTFTPHHMRPDICAPTFAPRHLRIRHMRANNCGVQMCNLQCTNVYAGCANVAIISAHM